MNADGYCAARGPNDIARKPWDGYWIYREASAGMRIVYAGREFVIAQGDLIVGDADAKVSVVATVNEAGRARGLKAGDVVKALAPVLGGRGGGKDDLAQGGGSDVTRIDEAIGLVPTLVAQAR